MKTMANREEISSAVLISRDYLTLALLPSDNTRAFRLKSISLKVSKRLHERLIQDAENKGEALQPMEER